MCIESYNTASRSPINSDQTMRCNGNHTSAAMAANKSRLLPAATLCFFLLVLAAQGKDNTMAILVIDDRARCQSDPSRNIGSKLKVVSP